MTFAELKREVFRRLQEVQATPAFWTDDDVGRAINEGYHELSDASEWDERWVRVDLLRERPYYDLRTVIHEPCLRLGAAFNDQTNRWLTPCTTGDLDKGTRRWETTTGEPTHVMTRGLWWMAYWPLSTGDQGTIKQYYTALPDVLLNDDDVPGFPETAHYGLVEYALSDLWAQDAETTQALRAWQTYLSYETAVTDFVQGRVAVPLVHGHKSTPP